VISSEQPVPTKTAMEDFPAFSDTRSTCLECSPQPQNTMFLGMLMATSWLFPPRTNALASPGPLPTTTLPQPRTAEDNPITPVPTYALATFDSRLSSISAERTAYPGCTFVEEAPPRPPGQPLQLTDTNPPVPRVKAESGRVSVKDYNTAPRRTRPVQPTVFDS
jgi:hypothetical protein